MAEATANGRHDSGTSRNTHPVKPRLLCADDDPVIRSNMVNALTRAGYDVVAVAGGDEAWALLQTEYFDALITDNEMPGLCGEELVCEIRHYGLTLPIIIASARLDFFLRADAQPLRVAALLQKPFLLRDLVLTTTQVLRATTSTIHLH